MSVRNFAITLSMLLLTAGPGCQPPAPVASADSGREPL